MSIREPLWVRLGLQDPFVYALEHGTGATTSMLLEALVPALAGHRVYLTAHSHDYTRDLAMRLRQWARQLGVDDIDVVPKTKDTNFLLLPYGYVFDDTIAALKMRAVVNEFSISVFCRGFLYALREQLHDSNPSFRYDITHFHDPFIGAMRDFALASAIAKEIAENQDPVFGDSPEASRMVLEGVRDFILTLAYPNLTRAQFKISRETAKKALDQMKECEVLRALAARFKSTQIA